MSCGGALMWIQGWVCVFVRACQRVFSHAHSLKFHCGFDSVVVFIWRDSLEAGLRMGKPWEV